MLSYLLRQLTNSLGIFFRTIRAFFTRKLVGAQSYLRRITNFSRQATKVASASLQGAAAAVKKPTKREDYIETRRLFISKSFLILLAIGAVLLGLLIYFVIWPFLLRTFFTAHLWQGDEDLAEWSGRVIVYYDEEKTMPMYSGTLEDGVLQGRGREYDEDGLLTYEGSFADGLYSGNGTRYDGGVLVYEGQFSAGLYEGTGSLYEGGSLVYYGAFSAGEANGMGTAYADGAVCYEGAFVNGLYEGEGTAYYADGTVRYKGAFSAGVYEGVGTAYHSDGTRAYVGSFAAGLYDGRAPSMTRRAACATRALSRKGSTTDEGTLYLDGEDQIQAEFSAGDHHRDDTVVSERQAVVRWRRGRYHAGRLRHPLCRERGGDLQRGDGPGHPGRGVAAHPHRRRAPSGIGDASLTETDQVDGFLIVNEDLGLTALCTYQQEGTEAQVYRLWFAPEAGTAAETLLPWERLAQAQIWAVADRDPKPEMAAFQGAIYQADGTVGGDWYQSQYRYEDYVCTLLSTREDTAPVGLSWSRDMELPGDGGGSGGHLGVPGTGAAGRAALRPGGGGKLRDRLRRERGAGRRGAAAGPDAHRCGRAGADGRPDRLLRLRPDDLRPGAQPAHAAAGAGRGPDTAPAGAPAPRLRWTAPRPPWTPWTASWPSTGPPRSRPGSPSRSCAS